jgi:hypothetical protein
LDRTIHDRIAQYKVEDIEQISSCTMFRRQNIILVFWTTCAEGKKLSHGSVGDKNFSSCPVPWPPICPVPETVLKSNTAQLNLCFLVLYCLVDQMHVWIYCIFFVRHILCFTYFNIIIWLLRKKTSILSNFYFF